ncbi:MAG: gamma-glutamyltransferase [Pirellulales bacterium]|nr:gamma-glutamyltransferase [Pirellulales bacterium]
MPNLFTTTCKERSTQHRISCLVLIVTVTISWWCYGPARTAVAQTPTTFQRRTASTVQSQRVADGKHGMVAAVSPPAVDVGVEILKAGGNAVDAAVAVAFAEAVTWPEAGNIGGGGFMLVAPGRSAEDKSPTFFDYRETAPAAATPDMFALGESRLTARFVGTPGTVRGLELAHKKFGKLSWPDLVKPAVALARDGFEVNTALARSLNGVLRDRRSVNNAEMHRVFDHPEGRLWRNGDRLLQPELAATLERIMEQGAAGFYTGRTAELFVAEMRRSGGLITAADLTNYEAKERTPIHSTYRGYDIYGAPPPSSGGIANALALNMLEGLNLKREDRFAPRTLHVMAEAMRRAFHQRAMHLGDADFVEVPEYLTSKEFASELAASLHERATPSRSLAEEMEILDGGENTTHFSVVDDDGMAVSNTYTLEHSFGSRVVVNGGGFFLNNEMGDFNQKPGHTDERGNIGTPANVIAPGKRMLSSMSPTIVKRDGELVLVTGSPGGRTIINTVLCIVVNVLEYEMEIGAAVDAPRIHHQWFPDQLRVETHRFGNVGEDLTSTIEALRSMGHRVTTVRGQGDAHSIFYDAATGQLRGAADKRLDGKAAGY